MVKIDRVSEGQAVLLIAIAEEHYDDIYNLTGEDSQVEQVRILSNLLILDQIYLYSRTLILDIIGLLEEGTPEMKSLALDIMYNLQTGEEAGWFNDEY